MQILKLCILLFFNINFWEKNISDHFWKKNALKLKFYIFAYKNLYIMHNPVM